MHFQIQKNIAIICYCYSGSNNPINATTIDVMVLNNLMGSILSHCENTLRAIIHFQIETNRNGTSVSIARKRVSILGRLGAYKIYNY